MPEREFIPADDHFVFSQSTADLFNDTLPHIPEIIVIGLKNKSIFSAEVIIMCFSCKPLQIKGKPGDTDKMFFKIFNFPAGFKNAVPSA